MGRRDTARPCGGARRQTDVGQGSKDEGWGRVHRRHCLVAFKSSTAIARLYTKRTLDRTRAIVRLRNERVLKKYEGDCAALYDAPLQKYEGCCTATILLCRRCCRFLSTLRQSHVRGLWCVETWGSLFFSACVGHTRERHAGAR